MIELSKSERELLESICSFIERIPDMLRLEPILLDQDERKTARDLANRGMLEELSHYGMPLVRVRPEGWMYFDEHYLKDANHD